MRQELQKCDYFKPLPAHRSSVGCEQKRLRDLRPSNFLPAQIWKQIGLWMVISAGLCHRSPPTRVLAAAGFLVAVFATDHHPTSQQPRAHFLLSYGTYRDLVVNIDTSRSHIVRLVDKEAYHGVAAVCGGMIMSYLAICL